MTGQEWMESSDPEVMLDFATHQIHDNEWHHKKPCDRKLRLFACACCRSVWHLLTDERSRHAVEVAERYADGLAKYHEVEALTGGIPGDLVATSTIARFLHPGDAINNAKGVVGCAQMHNTAILPRYADLLREIIGNPFHHLNPADMAKVSLASRNEAFYSVRRIAQRIYKERDWPAMPILADAMEEGGVGVQVVWDHLRSPGPHVRGCWALDLALWPDVEI